MLQKLTHFIKYHNALPIALSVVLIGSGAAFAASPEARELVISEETIVRSVDNSYIVSINLEAHNPQLLITRIEEDDSSYYVTYTYDTISIDDYVWKKYRTEETLNVSKAALNNRDLGLYVAEEISEVISGEEVYLKEVQSIEKNKGFTQKIATTEYSGLVGKMLSSKEEVFEGYVPLIPDEKPIVNSVGEGKISAIIAANNTMSAQVAAAIPSKEEIKQIIRDTVEELISENKAIADISITSGTTTSTATTTPSSTDTNIDTEAPVITINGNNPAEIAVGGSYSDLGATVIDNTNNNLGIKYLVNGVEVSNINIDTTADRTFTITYSATDQAGNIGTAERTVIVGTGILSIPEEVVEEDTATSTPEVVIPADTTAPIISLNGEVSITLTEGDAYTDAGATALDEVDGDITGQITTTGSVDTAIAGIYSISYSVSDTAGNEAQSVTRTVTVEAAAVEPEPEPEVSPVATSTPVSQ
jgi:hypothetical protein